MITFKRNRRGNYTAGTLLIVKPKTKAGLWRIFNGSARRHPIGAGTTLKAAQALAALTFTKPVETVTP